MDLQEQRLLISHGWQICGVVIATQEFPGFDRLR